MVADAYIHIDPVLCLGMITGRGGLIVRPLPSLHDAVLSLTERLYAGTSRPDESVTGKSQPKTERNNEVKRLYSIGWKVPDIAKYFGVSIPRVYQILRMS